jgi:hypothetical protein
MTARLVVFAPNWLGDAVMALPAVADVRQHFAALFDGTRDQSDRHARESGRRR